MKKLLFIAVFTAVILAAASDPVHAENVDRTVIKMETASGTIYLSLEAVEEPAGTDSVWLIESDGDTTLHLVDNGGNIGLCLFRQSREGLRAETKYINPSLKARQVLDVPAAQPLMAAAASVDVQEQYSVPKRLTKLKNAPSFFNFEKEAKKLFKKSGLAFKGASVLLYEGFVKVTAVATNGVAVTWTYDGGSGMATDVSVKLP